jgi:hypothetical protein
MGLPVSRRYRLADILQQQIEKHNAELKKVSKK